MSILIDILSAGVVDSTGSVLANGRAYLYRVGTTTLANVYSDKDLTVVASNPVTLNSAGKAEVYTFEKVRLVLENSSGVQIDDIDSVGNLDGSISASRVLQSDASGNISSSGVTSTELGYLSGVTSAIQTQLNNLRLKRPSYRSNTSDASQIIVPATTSSPAIVRINGVYYTNTSNKTLDIDTAGRNGLDTGAKAINTPYYLYAIPPVSGTNFDLVCSVTAPSGAGPTGFPNWSYIGAFATDSFSGTATIQFFIAVDGFYSSDNEIEVESHTGSTAITSKTFQSLPTTAKFAYGQLSSDGATANATARATGTSTANNNAIVVIQATVNNEDYVAGFVPIFTNNTIYLQIDVAGNTVQFLLLGWKENPEEFQ